MQNKDAYERLKSRPDTEGFAQRDVYEDQQFARGELQTKKSPIPWKTAAVVVSIIIFIVSWVLLSFIDLIRFNFFLSNDNKSQTTLVGSESTNSNKLRYDPGSLNNYYISKDDFSNPLTGAVTKYSAVDENGKPIGKWYDNYKDVPKPDWYVNSKMEYEEKIRNNPEGVKKEQEQKQELKKQKTFAGQFKRITFWKFVLAFGFAGFVYSILDAIFMRNLEAQNMLADTSDINQYKNDQHIMLPQEMFENPEFDFFPDVGCHSSVQVSSMISHVALENKGLDPVKISRKHKKDVVDEKGNLVNQKHEIMVDDEGEIIYDVKPKIDKDFMNNLYEASGIINNKLKKFFDPKKIAYNPGNTNRDRLKGYDTLADVINKDWELPYFEHQRPAGAYVVDTSPVNTMVLAITRVADFFKALFIVNIVGFEKSLIYR